MELVEENVEQFYYQATYDLGYDIASYYYDPDFAIDIRDVYTGRTLQITKDNFKKYNVTNPSQNDVNEWMHDSLQKNNGILINVDGSKFYIMQWMYCEYEPKGITFGWNTSEVTITLSNRLSFSFYTKILPKLYRTDAYQYDKSKEDPLMSATDLRPGFDYNEPEDFDAVKTNIVYRTTSSLYVNTSANDNDDALSKASPMVPLYVTDISAYESNTKLGSTYFYNLNEISSYIHDVQNDIYYELPLSAKYTSGELVQYSKTVTAYSGYSADDGSKYDLSANLTYYEFKQLIYNLSGTPMFKKNRIEFGLHTEAGAEPLLPLTISFSENDLQFNKDAQEKDITVTVTNPNLEIKTREISLSVDDSNETNPSMTIGSPVMVENGVWQATAHVSFTPEQDRETPWPYAFIVKAYCTGSTTHPERSEEVVKTQTMVMSTLDTTYTSEVLSPVSIKFDNIYPTNWILTSRKKTGSADVIIDNSVNTGYPSYAISHLEELPEFPNITAYTANSAKIDYILDYDILDISANGDDPEEETWITVSGYMDGSTLDWSKSKVKEFTSAEYTSGGWHQATDPYEELKNCSLFTPSTLNIKGGYIGSKDILCKNLLVENNGEIDAPAAIASGYGAGSADIWESNMKYPVSAETITLHNNPTINELYVTKKLYVNSQNIDSIYIPDISNSANYINGTVKSTTKILQWENPELPALDTIPTFEFEIPAGAPSVHVNDNGTHVFGTEGEFTEEDKYNMLTSNNNATFVFYPGTYYFQGISCGANCKFVIHSEDYTSTNDTSVKIYVKNSLSLANNVMFDVPKEAKHKDLKNYYGYAASFILYAENGAQIAANGSNSTGIITSPKGTVYLSSQTVWNGNIWADTLTMQNGAKLIITPYDEKDLLDTVFMERLKKYEEEHIN